MQLSRDPNPGLGFSEGRCSVYPMFADISALHQDQGDTRRFGSVWWDGLNRHAHVDQLKFYPQFVHVLKAYAPSSMMTMPKTQRMRRFHLTQLNNFQIDIQDLHQCRNDHVVCRGDSHGSNPYGDFSCRAVFLTVTSCAKHCPLMPFSLKGVNGHTSRD